MELLRADGNEAGDGDAMHIKPYSQNPCYWQYHGKPLLLIGGSDRENHDYRLLSDSPALSLGFQQIDTSEIGLKKDFPYKDAGRFSVEHGLD